MDGGFCEKIEDGTYDKVADNRVCIDSELVPDNRTSHCFY